jgi:hypothetical protein
MHSPHLTIFRPLLLPLFFVAVRTAAVNHVDVNMAAAGTSGLDTLSEYFIMLAGKIESYSYMAVAPLCDMTQAELPTG